MTLKEGWGRGGEEDGRWMGGWVRDRWVNGQQDNFDFIHARNLAQAINNWPKLYREMYRCTAPGGWVELGELGGEIFSDDNTLAPDNAVKRCFELTTQAMEKLGRPAAKGPAMKAGLEAAGFVDVEVITYKNAMAPWPKDPRLKHAGAMVMLQCETGIDCDGFWEG